jgi:hypothetical protein
MTNPKPTTPEPQPAPQPGPPLPPTGPTVPLPEPGIPPGEPTIPKPGEPIPQCQQEEDAGGLVNPVVLQPGPGEPVLGSEMALPEPPERKEHN